MPLVRVVAASALELEDLLNGVACSVSSVYVLEYEEWAHDSVLAAERCGDIFPCAGCDCKLIPVPAVVSECLVCVKAVLLREYSSWLLPGLRDLVGH